MTVSLLKYRIRTKSGGIWDDLDERETDYQPTSMEMNEKIDRLKTVCIGTEQEKQEAEVWNDDFLVMRFSYHPNFFYRTASDIPQFDVYYDTSNDVFNVSALNLLNRKILELDSSLKKYERIEKHQETVLDFETQDLADQLNRGIENLDEEVQQASLLNKELIEIQNELQKRIIELRLRRYLNNG